MPHEWSDSRELSDRLLRAFSPDESLASCFSLARTESSLISGMCLPIEECRDVSWGEEATRCGDNVASVGWLSEFNRQRKTKCSDFNCKMSCQIVPSTSLSQERDRTQYRIRMKNTAIAKPLEFGARVPKHFECTAARFAMRSKPSEAYHWVHFSEQVEKSGSRSRQWSSNSIESRNALGNDDRIMMMFSRSPRTKALSRIIFPRNETRKMLDSQRLDDFSRNRNISH